MPLRISVLNGPNLGRLGRRETALYGSTTAAQLAGLCREWGADLGCDVRFAQTDGEGELVRLIHAAADETDGAVLNAGAYTHTSVALRDALLAVTIPVVELHITSPASREPLRRRNLLSDVVTASVHGFGIEGYRLALAGLVHLLERPDS
jgi:3-dehydroquinate dehydratase-2